MPEKHVLLTSEGTSMADYGGYASLEKARRMEPSQVIEELGREH